MSTETLILAGVILLLISAIARPRARRRRHSFFYDWYMKSRLWKFRRWLWYWGSNRRCEGCGQRMVLHGRGVRHLLGAPVMTVHHRNYKRLGHEHRSDVALLCWTCHSRQDGWRHR